LESLNEHLKMEKQKQLNIVADTKSQRMPRNEFVSKMPFIHREEIDHILAHKDKIVAITGPPGTFNK
jgi:hypothetical protein